MRLCPGSPAPQGGASAAGGSAGGMQDGGKRDKEAGGRLTAEYKQAESVKGSQTKSCRIKRSKVGW